MSRQLVLVGGGHAHVQVIRALAEHPEPDIAVTLVTDRLLTPYSGMLPGHIAGFYSHSEMHIDLGRLARVSGVSLVAANACGIDRTRRVVETSDGRRIPYDLLSLNVGITPDLSGIEGAERYGIAVKPISTFLERLEALLADAARPEGPRRIVLVGGGAAGIELALALKARLKNLDSGGRPFRIAIAAGHALVPTLNAGLRRKAYAALARHGVTVLDSFRVAQIQPDGIRAEDGRLVGADAVLVSTAARAPDWLGETGLATTDGGFLSIAPTLASISDPRIFAVGDCATVVDAPMPKAGVFAVRQGAALTTNLRRALRDKPLMPHRPDPDFLTILMIGDGSAIAGHGSWLALEGRWVWRWKDRIDRRFMRRFSDFRL
jgi:pyridine nucleotide-disulfide oxidoreductase family protein